MHRPANVDDPAILGPVLKALIEVGHGCPLVLPAHPHTAKALHDADSAELRVIDPLGYLDFIALEAQAAIVLTDSGGIQEETTILGVPCLTFRDNTERPITVSEGTNTVVGREPERIVAEARRVLRDGVEQQRPALWDEQGERIAEVLTSTPLSEWPRPTSP